METELKQLRQKAESYLHEGKFSAESIRRYNYSWDKLNKFMSENEYQQFNQEYMTETGLLNPINSQRPLFPNPQGGKLSRMAVLNIIKKYADMARVQKPELIPEDVGCHTLRHSKAMHMLEAGINLVWIRDFLGHSSTTTTEIYARASSKMKEDALAKLIRVF